MSKITSIFEELDPLDVIWNAMIEKNPALVKYGRNSFRVLKILPATGTRNTEARVVGIGDAGIEGIMSVFYDRASLAKVANAAITPARNPTLVLALATGTVLPLATVLPQLNSLLGFNLKLDGLFPDVATVNITVPARGAKVSFSLQGLASATGGFPPVSLRTLPATVLTVDVVNRGPTIGSVATNRGLNPFVKTDGNINWTAETISANPANAKKSLLLKILNVDFSDLINEVTERSNVYWGGLQSGNAVAWFVRQALVDGIKKRCTDLGLPIIDFGKPCRQSGWDVSFDAQLPGHAAKFWNSIFRPMADLGTAAWANPKFAKCMLTTSSFQNVYGFPTTGNYVPIAAKVEAKEGWATDLANYPINYNLP